MGASAVLGGCPSLRVDISRPAYQAPRERRVRIEGSAPSASPSSRGPGRGPFKAKTRVRIPLGTPPIVWQIDHPGHKPLECDRTRRTRSHGAGPRRRRETSAARRAAREAHRAAVATFRVEQPAPVRQLRTQLPLVAVAESAWRPRRRAARRQFGLKVCRRACARPERRRASASSRPAAPIGVREPLALARTSLELPSRASRAPSVAVRRASARAPSRSHASTTAVAERPSAASRAPRRRVASIGTRGCSAHDGRPALVDAPSSRRSMTRCSRGSGCATASAPPQLPAPRKSGEQILGRRRRAPADRQPPFAPRA